ncbi:MAG: tetratricopeptide repeat protein, partial [Rhodothermales bacterium]|nr:tetratricopeptide repeat protein [Rhodothermales bacterium]
LAQQAISIDPDNPSFQDTLGWILFLLDRPAEAREWVQRAVDATSGNATMLEHLGDIEASLGLMESARTRWLRALEITPDNELLKEKLDRVAP